MKKEDFKTGMFVICTNGELGMIIRDFHHTSNGEIVTDDVVIFQHGWSRISDWDDNLKMLENRAYSIEHVFIRNVNNAGPETWDFEKDRKMLY